MKTRIFLLLAILFLLPSTSAVIVANTPHPANSTAPLNTASSAQIMHLNELYFVTPPNFYELNFNPNYEDGTEARLFDAFDESSWLGVWHYPSSAASLSIGEYAEYLLPYIGETKLNYHGICNTQNVSYVYIETDNEQIHSHVAAINSSDGFFMLTYSCDKSKDDIYPWDDIISSAVLIYD